MFIGTKCEFLLLLLVSLLIFFLENKYVLTFYFGLRASELSAFWVWLEE